jgi:hypothetical protein
VAIQPPCRLAELPGGKIRIAAVKKEDGNGLLVGKREQLLAELERRLVGEVEVLEHEAEWLLAG